MKTLLIIDMQNGFIKKENKKLPSLIASHISKENYGEVLFTKFINYSQSPFVRLLGWKKLFTSPETDIVPELMPFVKSGSVFIKSTYSAFKSKKLLSFLKRKGIKKLDMCGLESDGCVLGSAFEAFDLGFEVNVLRKLIFSTAALNKATDGILERNIDRLGKK